MMVRAVTYDDVAMYFSDPADDELIYTAAVV